MKRVINRFLYEQLVDLLTLAAETFENDGYEDTATDCLNCISLLKKCDKLKE